MLCCRCGRDSPPGKFCKICGGLLNAVPLSGKMPQPAGQNAPQQPAPPAQPEPHSRNTAFLAALAVIALLLTVTAIIAFLVK